MQNNRCKTAVIKNKIKVILNLIQYLQRGLFGNSNNNALRGRSRIKYKMTSFQGVGPVLRPYGAALRSGFTLIELLVVVLIIGILAAVALPQYRKSIEKSKAVQALVLLKSLAQAQEAHYLDNGDYATSWPELVVNLPADFRPGGTYYSYKVKNAYTNGLWVIEFGANSSLHGGFYMGHPAGHAYQGAGFLYVPKWATLYPGIAGEIGCLELKQDVIYKKAPGSFCQKLLHGTLYKNYDGFRLYTLP